MGIAGRKRHSSQRVYPGRFLQHPEDMEIAERGLPTGTTYCDRVAFDFGCSTINSQQMTALRDFQANRLRSGAS